MTKKPNHLQKQLKFHCSACQTLYQLLEIQSGKNDNCLEQCLTKWQELLAKYYQEKVLFHLSQQESEPTAAQSEDLAEQ
jgi:hypothetical protein